jgi:hypothetical protein
MSKVKQNSNNQSHESVTKRTKQGGGRIKTSSLSKNEKRSYKKYKGQGR